MRFELPIGSCIQGRPCEARVRTPGLPTSDRVGSAQRRRAYDARREMEARSLTLGAEESAWRRLKDSADRRPAVAALILIGAKGLHAVAQTGLTGLSLGAIYALGAVGLTLVYGILRLVNFAHGDFLTFGAYMAYVVNVTWGMPLVLAIFWAMAMTAVLGIFLEKVMWGPMRARGAGMLQLLLMAIGLALVLRYVIQFI